ncbi:uncharacterized protein LOC122808587 [Protopterus annectens]|uniref:uncharacterized protein LOC122808587 n=1 Tax=Protopterus annectens TaxID=7888 RepID=UPI001CF99449|nr:uncharacterized protein LOC122808587 [Protopterus annectens]
MSNKVNIVVKTASQVKDNHKVFFSYVSNHNCSTQQCAELLANDLTVAKSRQHQKREAFSYKENAILLQALRKHGLRLVHKSSPRSEVTNQLWEVLLQRINAVSRYGRTRAQCRNRICKMIQLARKKAKEIITAHNTTLGGGLPFPKLTDTEEFLVHLSEYDFLRNFPGNNFDISAKADMDSQVSKDSEQSPINLDQSKDPESISMDVECHQNKEGSAVGSRSSALPEMLEDVNRRMSIDIDNVIIFMRQPKDSVTQLPSLMTGSHTSQQLHNCRK